MYVGKEGGGIVGTFVQLFEKLLIPEVESDGDLQGARYKIGYF